MKGKHKHDENEEEEEEETENNGEKGPLMVNSGDETVNGNRQAASHISGQETIDVKTVDTSALRTQTSHPRNPRNDVYK